MFILAELLTNKPQPFRFTSIILHSIWWIHNWRKGENLESLRFLCLVPSGFGGDVGGFGTRRAPVKSHGRYINNHPAVYKYRLQLLLLVGVLRDCLGWHLRGTPSRPQTAKYKPNVLSLSPHMELGFHFVLPTSVPWKLPRLTFYARSDSHFKSWGIVCGQLWSNCQILFSVGFAWMQRDQCGDWWWKPFERFWRLKWENLRGRLFEFSGPESARAQRSLTTNLHAVVLTLQYVMHNKCSHRNMCFFFLPIYKDR